MVPLPAANLDHSTMLLAAGYIFGGNESRQKVAMTAPVGVSTGTEGASAPGTGFGHALRLCSYYCSNDHSSPRNTVCTGMLIQTMQDIAMG
jgi:hypothetical protein